MAKGKDDILLDVLAHIEGYDSSAEMLEEKGLDSVVPAICTTPGCSYTTSMEPDQDKGFCDECKTNSVKSCLILAGII
jgi:hypothetical protein